MNLFDELTDLDVREVMAIEVLRQHEPDDGYWLAFSGGRCSQTIYRLAEKADVRFEAHMNRTGVDPIEVLDFIRAHYPDVIFDHPERHMFSLIVHKRFPPRGWKGYYCCANLKEHGGKGRVVITGVRRAESSARTNRPMIEPCGRGGSRALINPIVYWSDKDVIDYLQREGLPHCSLYDEGRTRIGCILCPKAGEVQRYADIVRWPHVAHAYTVAFKRMLKARAERGQKTTWRTGAEVFKWWMKPTRKRKVPPNLSLYGDDGG